MMKLHTIHKQIRAKLKNKKAHSNSKKNNTSSGTQVITVGTYNHKNVNLEHFNFKTNIQQHLGAK